MLPLFNTNAFSFFLFRSPVSGLVPAFAAGGAVARLAAFSTGTVRLVMTVVGIRNEFFMTMHAGAFPLSSHKITPLGLNIY